MVGRGADEGIVDRPTGDAVGDGGLEELEVEGRREREEVVAETPHQELPHDTGRSPVGRRKSGEDRIALQSDVGSKGDARRCGGARNLVGLVPAGEECHDEAGVDGDHRRVRSTVARTTSSVSGGSS